MSPHFKLEKKEMRIPLSEEVLTKFKNRQAYLNLDFDVVEGSGGIFTTIRFDEEFQPSFVDQFKAPRMRTQIPLSQCEFPIEKVVKSQDEASLLKRWAYQNIEVHIDGSDLILNWKITP
jgi:hypothetical protein